MPANRPSAKPAPGRIETRIEARPAPEFEQLAAGEPRGRRPDAMRETARAFRARFGAGGTIRALRSIDLVTFSCPSSEAFGSAAGPIPSWLTLVGRMLIIQFEDFEGGRRTLLWEPWQVDGLEALPLLARSEKPRAATIGGRAAPYELCSLPQALARLGLGTEAVDLVGFGDLRGHDVRSFAGTTQAPADEYEARRPIFESALVLVRDEALEAAKAPHPLQAPWYVPGAAEELAPEQLAYVAGDMELGVGVALIATPGRAAGHQSLVLNTLEGVWVVSSNGVVADCWQPLLSKIPGLRRSAEQAGRDVVVGAADDALALYDSLVLERSLADVSRADPRWLTVLPTPALSRTRRQWPALPTFAHRTVDHGVMELPD